MPSPRLLAVLIAVVVLYPARAGADGIALEAYVGDRPTDADSLVGPVLAELGADGFTTGADARRAIESHLALPITAAPAGQLAEASTRIAKAYDAYIDGDCAAAVPLLEPAIAVIAGHPVEAREGKVRDDYYRALVVLAACRDQQRSAEAAAAAMTEVLRTFPDRPVTTVDFAPKVAALYRKVKEAVAKQGTGTLTVKVDEPGPVVFVNERLVGTGEVVIRDLAPGPYRVFVEAGGERGRLHLVSVHPGADARVDVGWGLEARLRSDAFNGLAFASQGQLDRDAVPFALRVARELGAGAAVIITIGEADGHRAVIGTVVDVATGAVRRRGTMALEPTLPPERKLRLLGRYLAGDEVNDPLLRTGQAVARVDADRPSPRAGSSFRRRAGLVVGIAGVASLGAGTYFGIRTLQLHGQAKEECEPDWTCSANGVRLEKRAHTSANLSNAFLVAGALATAGGVVLWLTSSPRSEHLEIAPAVGPDGAGVTLSGRF